MQAPALLERQREIGKTVRRALDEFFTAETVAASQRNSAIKEADAALAQSKETIDQLRSAVRSCIEQCNAVLTRGRWTARVTGASTEIVTLPDPKAPARVALTPDPLASTSGEAASRYIQMTREASSQLQERLTARTPSGALLGTVGFFLGAFLGLILGAILSQIAHWGSGYPELVGTILGSYIGIVRFTRNLQGPGNEAVQRVDGRASMALRELSKWQADEEREQQVRVEAAEGTYSAEMSSVEEAFYRALVSAARDARTQVSDVDEISPAWNRPAWAALDTLALRGVIRYGIVSGSWRDMQVTLPVIVALEAGCSMLVMSNGGQRESAVAFIQSHVLRLLTSAPAGKVRFTFVDPLGLGQNAAPFMHLADYDEALVTGKAWSEPGHIEQRLSDLTEHMENVIQKYLRNQFATIEEYNADAGEIAEAYRILVVFDFPVNFSEASARRLVSIAQNGPRCGVHTIVLADTSKPMPHGFTLDDLSRVSTVIAWDAELGRFVWQDEDFADFMLELDTPPESAVFQRIIERVGEAAKAAARVEVPFERIAPAERDWWQARAIGELRAPLGPTGARKVQYLELGKGTANHALVVGRTGSGKSTLLHTLITNLALTYSPDEVELYLIDFKEGVEFKLYATHSLPHARVVAIESEREFGLSVLDGLDAELARRGDTYRAAGVDSLTDFRQKSGRGMPRVLLLVDEFQLFFAEDDGISTRSSQILDRLVRQGRAFGIHVLLGSQTLAGSYSLSKSTIDQMAVRIALQCSEADSRLILADDNPAARLLSRPGEAIYNAGNGRVDANSRFQVAWLADEQRDRLLGRVREMAAATAKRNGAPVREPIVFEGNAPADAHKNAGLAQLLSDPIAASASSGARVWLGDPMAIREPVAAVLRRQSGSNLLIVGQREETARAILALGALALAAQNANGARDGALPLLSILDFGSADSAGAESFDKLANTLPGLIRVGRRRHLADMLATLDSEVKRRIEEDDDRAPSRYLIIHGLQRARDLRQEDSFSSFGSFGEAPAEPNPGAALASVLRDGPEVGIHTLAWCDTMTNLTRTLDRRALREFTLRVAFQMSSEDSANLVDTPAASRLGPNRALFVNEDEGRTEKLRPYALPDSAWIETAAGCLAMALNAPPV